MRQRLVGSAAALGLLAGGLLGWIGWIMLAVLGLSLLLGLVILGAELARPFMRATREVAAEQPDEDSLGDGSDFDVTGDWWNFAGASRID